MRTGILGGTFDPIHFGHIQTGKMLTELNKVDRVFYVVAGNPYHKNRKVTEGFHRFNMAEIALKPYENLIPCDIEIKRNKESYSIETLEELEKLYDDEFYFITGADMLIDIPKWHRAEEFMKKCKFLAVNRNDAFLNPDYEKKVKEQIKKFDMKVELVNIKTMNVSSTMVRNEKTEKILEYVPREVLKYIKENNLYK